LKENGNTVFFLMKNGSPTFWIVILGAKFSFTCFLQESLVFEFQQFIVIDLWNLKHGLRYADKTSCKSNKNYNQFQRPAVYIA